MAVNAPEDRRFRRGRAAPVGRRRRTEPFERAVKVALGLAMLAAAGTLAWWGGAGAMDLRVSRIEVAGNAHLSTAEALSLLDGLVGEPILRVELDHWRSRLLGSPWVADASLRRVLPDTVEVTVTERVPLAIGRVGSTLVLVDAQGMVIDEYSPRYEAFDLPIVDGLAQLGSPGAALQGPRARLVAAFLADLSADRDLFARVSQVNVSDPANVIVTIDDDHARLLLGDREFRKRLVSYVELRPALRARVAEAEYVDMRFANRVFVRPAKGYELNEARPATDRSSRAPS